MDGTVGTFIFINFYRYELTVWDAQFGILESAIFVRAVVYIGLLGAAFTFCANNEDVEECRHFQTRSVLQMLFYTTDLLLSSLGTAYTWRLFYDLTCGQSKFREPLARSLLRLEVNLLLMDTIEKKRINFDNAYYEPRDEERSIVFK